jgi:uncharacterized protein
MARKIVQEFLRFGLDFSIKSNVRKVARILGVSPDMVDRIYIELRNEIDKEKFSETELSERVLLLPQCLRNSRECKALLEDRGFRCAPVNGCSTNCPVHQIKSVADELGYTTFILPGGSMSVEILRSIQPKAIVAVACFGELEIGMTRVKKNGEIKKIRAQMIPLLKDGCKDTMVNIDEVFESLRLHNEHKN